MSMKEIQNLAACDSLKFGSKEVFETKISGDYIKGIGDISTVNGNGAIDSISQNGIFGNPCDLEKGSGSLSSGIHDKGKHSVNVEAFTLCNANEHENSNSQCEGSFDLFETSKNDFTVKNVLECDRPELEVMKDICVDNGMPEIKEENDGKLFEQESLKPFSVVSSEKCTSKLCDLLKLVQAATKPSEENSLVCKKPLIQKAGTQVLLESFPDGGRRKLVQLTNQIEDGKGKDSKYLLQKISIKKTISVGDAASSSEAGGPKDNAQAGSVLFDSNVQSNFSDTEQVQCTSRSIVDLHKQSDGSSANSNIQCVSSGKQHIGANSDDQIRSPSDKSQCSTSDNSPAVNPGETSFSAVAYSDPVSFSRSLSHRSDASTTSARSFAFPVLQSEWNSSPVRMAKADRRHFRKRKGWRLGVLCCRF